MTFSIIALDRRSRALGVAVATGSTHVADRVPHVEPNVGAVATQGYTLVAYGPWGLGLLKKGLEPRQALEIMLKADPGRELRQVGILSASGSAAAHTGRSTPEWHGHLIGPDYVILGNLITGPEVLTAMRDAFEAMRERGLGEALISALEAGREAGGDLRGERSTALFLALPDGRVLRLRIDRHPDPISALRALWRKQARL